MSIFSQKTPQIFILLKGKISKRKALPKKRKKKEKKAKKIGKKQMKKQTKNGEKEKGKQTAILPVFPVERTQSDRFGNVCGADVFASVKVGDGARYA